MTAQTQINALPAHLQAILAGSFTLNNSETTTPQKTSAKKEKIKALQSQYSASVTSAGDSVTMRAIEESEELEPHDIQAGDNTLIIES